MNKLVETAQAEVRVALEEVKAGTITVSEFVEQVDKFLNPIRQFSHSDRNYSKFAAMIDEVHAIIPIEYRYDTTSIYWYSDACYDLPKMNIMDDKIFNLLLKAINEAALNDSWDVVRDCFRYTYENAVKRIAEGYENPQALAQRAWELKVQE